MRAHSKDRRRENRRQESAAESGGRRPRPRSAIAAGPWPLRAGLANGWPPTRPGNDFDDRRRRAPSQNAPKHARKREASALPPTPRCRRNLPVARIGLDALSSADAATYPPRSPDIVLTVFATKISIRLAPRDFERSSITIRGSTKPLAATDEEADRSPNEIGDHGAEHLRGPLTPPATRRRRPV
jgi:hypothetical protein